MWVDSRLIFGRVDTLLSDVLRGREARDQERLIKLWHIKLCPVISVTSLPSQVLGQKYLCSLGSEDST